MSQCVLYICKVPTTCLAANLGNKAFYFSSEKVYKCTIKNLIFDSKLVKSIFKRSNFIRFYLMDNAHIEHRKLLPIFFRIKDCKVKKSWTQSRERQIHLRFNYENTLNLVNRFAIYKKMSFLKWVLNKNTLIISLTFI